MEQLVDGLYGCGVSSLRDKIGRGKKLKVEECVQWRRDF